MRFIRDIHAAKKALGQPVISFEFFPPKTNEGEKNLFEKHIPELMKLRPDFCSVTYGAGGSTRELTHELVVRITVRTDRDCIGRSFTAFRPRLLAHPPTPAVTSDCGETPVRTAAGLAKRGCFPFTASTLCGFRICPLRDFSFQHGRSHLRSRSHFPKTPLARTAHRLFPL